MSLLLLPLHFILVYFVSLSHATSSSTTTTSSYSRSGFVEERDEISTVRPVHSSTIAALEQQILDVLDIDDVPNTDNFNNSMDNYVKKYMQNVYADIGRSSGPQEFRDADTVISLMPINSFPFATTSGVSFSTEGLPEESSLIRADLHISTEGVGKIDVFVMRKRQLRLLSSSAASSSLSINITSEFSKWISFDSPPELYISRDTHVRLLSVFCVAAFKNTGQVRREPKRRKRSPSPSPTPQQTVAPATTAYDPLRGELNGNVGCGRHGLYVNFKDLGWKDWILSPEGFEAFVCKGYCSFPLNNKMNPTNHAIVQNLIHLLHPSRAPEPRCAPSRLSFIKIMFMDNNKHVLIKKYQDMLVEECGCQ